MNYAEFIADVKSRGRLATDDEAETAACAMLNVLGQRLPAEKAGMLADQVPIELSECLKQNPNDEQFGIAEFYRRIGQREGIDPNAAAASGRAVGHALKDALGRSTFEEIVSILPYEYDELFGLDRVERAGRRAA